jgi:hypothetical protein
MQAYISKVNDFGNKAFKSTFMYNKYVTVFIQFLLILYIGRLSPRVPLFVAKLFNNPYYRLVVFALIFMYAQIDFTAALLMSFAFVMTMRTVSDVAVMEQLEDVTTAVEASNPDGVMIAPTQALAQADIGADLDTPIMTRTITVSPETIIIKPTSDGNGNVTIPNVVVAPVSVMNSNGQVGTLEANVSVIQKAPEEPVSNGAPLVPSGPLNLPPISPTEAPPISPVEAPPIAPVATAPAPAPVPMSNDEAVSNFASKVVEEIRAASSCYPSRRVDMSKVVGADTALTVGDFKASK